MTLRQKAMHRTTENGWNRASVKFLGLEVWAHSGMSLEQTTEVCPHPQRLDATSGTCRQNLQHNLGSAACAETTRHVAAGSPCKCRERQPGHHSRDKLYRGSGQPGQTARGPRPCLQWCKGG